MTDFKCTYPPEWADDELSQYSQVFFDNIVASFHNDKDTYYKLRDIDIIFLKLIDKMSNPHSLLVALLLTRCHSAFRSACLLVMAGQNAETYPLIRTCIEYAGYSLFVDQSDERKILFLNRHKDENSLKNLKQEFTPSKIKDCIKQKDPKLCSLYEKLYEQAIDLGGHPNERGLSLNSKIREEKGVRNFITEYMNADSKQNKLASKSVARAGLISLEIFNNIFKERFELLGLDKLMSMAKKGL